MKRKLMAATVLLGIALATAGCAEPILDPIPAPVTVELDELAGTTVEVPLGSLLNINVGDRDVASITAEIGDSGIAEFVPGYDDGSALFNPGVRPLAVGETTVTLRNLEGELDPVEFVLTVPE